MLINVTHAEESRVGIVRNGLLESFEIESLSREHLKGNIYKGVVHRIHPALEAAFIDIGAERDAFLPLDEICFRNLPRVPSESQGNGKRRWRIRDLLRTGEEVLVQITKEQFANKPPTLTTFYSLPGRYLVLLPGSEDAGISRKIEGEERLRVRKILNELPIPEGFGVIVRTAAGFDEDSGELSRDFNYLLRLWETIKHAARSKSAPALVYREHDIVLRTIRDFFTPDIDEIYIDNEEVFQRARTFLQDVMPGKEHVLHLYQGNQPIFSAFDVESQIESIFKRRVTLPSGASIVIDGTEALTAIDVNSGGSVRGPNPEETAFRTNMDAAREIARQLRLRDIGGLIVIDFIDMREAPHIQEVERAFRDAMQTDRARYEIGRISRFGLLEISRQRLRPAAAAATYMACPMCEGHGAIRTTESAALVALRKIHNRISHGDVASMRVSVPSYVGLHLLNQKRDDLAQLEQRYQTRVTIELNDRMMPHQIEMEPRLRAEAVPTPVRVSPGTVAVAEKAAATPASENGGAQPVSEGAGKKRRRRRPRRRGRGLRAAEAIAGTLTSLAQRGGAALAPHESKPAGGTPSGLIGGNGEAQQMEPASTAAETVAVQGSPAASAVKRTGRRRRSRGRKAAPQQAATPSAGGGEIVQPPAVAGPPESTERLEPSGAPSEETPATARVNKTRRGRRGGRRRSAAHARASEGESAAAVTTASASQKQASGGSRRRSSRSRGRKAESSDAARTAGRHKMSGGGRAKSVDDAE
jgi:ribonuclease E